MSDSENELLTSNFMAAVKISVLEKELTKLKQAIAILIAANEFYTNSNNYSRGCYDTVSIDAEDVAIDAKKQVDLILK